MKVTFPHMGNTMVYKKLLELLGHEIIDPPVPSKRTIDLGVKHSPEFSCFPMKVLMGSYLEALEMGADTIISSGGHGPCRAGYYGETHQRILNSLGHEVEVIIFDDFKDDFKDSMRKVWKVKNGKSWAEVWRTLKLSYRMSKALDRLEKQIQIKRAYEAHTGESTRVWEGIQGCFERVYNDTDLIEAEAQGQNAIEGIKLRQVPQEKRIKIGVVGEIYVVMEQSINMKIEELLGGLNAEVERSQYLSDWIDFNLLPKRYTKPHELEILKLGEPYIQEMIGGHAKQTVGHIVDYAQRGFDGVIHLMPFACLPELISQSVIPTITKEWGIPVLSLSIDEQTGTANVQTRVEAFIDMIKMKKSKLLNTITDSQNVEVKNEDLLYWHRRGLSQYQCGCSRQSV